MEPLRALALEDRMDRAHELMNTCMADLLAAIVRFDESEAWRVDGVRCMADWLAYKRGLAPATARDWVRIGHALTRLPAINQAFTDGVLSYDQVRLLVQFAGPETDEALAHEAPGWSAAELTAKLRDARRVTRRQAHAEHNNRELKFRWDEEERMLHLWGKIPGADGLLVQEAIKRTERQIPKDPVSDLPDWYARRCADALVELAGIKVGADPDPDRANIVVHVNQETLAQIEGTGLLGNSIPVAAETIRRLACDARVRPVIENDAGEPLGIGRASRTVPHWLWQVLKKRDGGCCRYHGCNRRDRLHAHHIIHWGHGGPTNEDNLILLCPYHHWLHHEGGFKIKMSPTGRLRFVRPDGSPLKLRPPRLRPSLPVRTRAP